MMFILLSKSHLILNEADLKADEADQPQSGCLVFNLKDDSTEPMSLKWPPAIVALNGDVKAKQPPSRVICGCVSPSEDYIALCDDNKNLVIFDSQFKAIRHYLVKRNCVKILFKNNKEAELLGCDKSGDIYEFDLSTSESEHQEKLLMGHCSMLLDFTLTSDNRYIISCDRDEKIRVTNYPNTYNVLNYCLGHQEFVSAVQLLDQTTLISGSGDGKVILWDFFQGKNLFSINCDQQEQQDSYGTQKEKSKFPIKSITTDQDLANYLAVSFYNQAIIYVFKVIRSSESASSLELLEKFALETEPIWVQFDKAHSNFLWVLGGAKAQSVEVFELKQDKLEKAFSTLKIVDRLNEIEPLKATIKKEHQADQVEGLFKHYYNNVEMYYQRKMLRIETENNKTRRFI